MTSQGEPDLIESRSADAGRLGWLAAAVALALAAIGGGWGWLAQQRAATAEAALATAVADRDTAVAAAEQRQTLLAQVEEARRAGETRLSALEQELEAARADTVRLQAAEAEIARLEAELAALVAPAAAPEPVTTGAEPAEPAAPAPAEQVAAATPEPAAVAPTRSEASLDPLVITFDVNSSYLPDNLGGKLRTLAERLEPGRRYGVELTASVGSGDVEGKSPDEALRYNRWMAERRIGRVTEFLQRNAKAEDLVIREEFAMNDASRRVVVEITPLAE